MPRAVAVNVAANTNAPGFRGPVYPDGSFAYVPIPEPAATLPRERYPVDEPLPTYADLDTPFSVPTALRETPIHMDPEFPGVHGRQRATYGDPYAVKAGRIGDRSTGDWLPFYATLSLRPYDWRGPGGTTVGDTEADERDGDAVRPDRVGVSTPSNRDDETLASKRRGNGQMLWVPLTVAPGFRTGLDVKRPDMPEYAHLRLDKPSRFCRAPQYLRERGFTAYPCRFPYLYPTIKPRGIRCQT